MYVCLAVLESCSFEERREFEVRQRVMIQKGDFLRFVFLAKPAV